MKTPFLLLGTVLLSAFVTACKNDASTTPPDTLPRIELAVFSNPTDITNTFFGPDSGKIYIYEGGAVGQSPDEVIRIERKTSTKTVNNITCIVQHDLVRKNGIVIEDTDDWLAQDDAGNLWYLGEIVKNYDDNGTFEDDDGSWEAGVDGALPGYWMPVNPTVGQKYHQEYYENEAEDEAEVLVVGQTVTIGFGTYTGCLVTKDYTTLESGVYEKKYYAPGIGLIKEEKFENEVLVETIELIEIQ